MQSRILRTIGKSIAAFLVAGPLVLLGSFAVAQTKPGPPAPEQTGAQYCEYSKGYVESLKILLKNNTDSWSVAMRTSVERDIAASEKETATCCGDLDQCKRTYEALAKKGSAT